MFLSETIDTMDDVLEENKTIFTSSGTSIPAMIDLYFKEVKHLTVELNFVYEEHFFGKGVALKNDIADIGKKSANFSFVSRARHSFLFVCTYSSISCFYASWNLKYGPVKNS